MRDNELGHAVDHLVGLALVLLEACLSHSPDDLCRAKPKPLRVDRHMLESPKCSQCGTIEAVVDHEVVDQKTPSRSQGLEGILVERKNDTLGDGATDVGHQHDVVVAVTNWPVWACRIKLHKRNTVLDVLRLLSLDALACATDLWQLQHCGLEAWGGLCEDVGKRSGSTSDIKHGANPAQIQLLAHEVLGSRHGAVVLRLRVGLGNFWIRKPRRIARGFACGHHFWKGSHPMVELTTNLVLQIIAVVVPG
mmetsp:Transcript_120872/g.170000  ORF Transcript_120872/g.170000 Transcript_120872/m.170000 type:complete len:250 (+) Transcript_120872:205-954(+)